MRPVRRVATSGSSSTDLIIFPSSSSLNFARATKTLTTTTNVNFSLEKFRFLVESRARKSIEQINCSAKTAALIMCLSTRDGSSQFDRSENHSRLVLTKNVIWYFLKPLKVIVGFSESSKRGFVTSAGSFRSRCDENWKMDAEHKSRGNFKIANFFSLFNQTWK